jgi:aspartate aminotransferase
MMNAQSMPPGSGRLVDLSLGDPGYEPPEQVKAAAVSALSGGIGGYAPQGGFPWLRQALAAKLRDGNNIAGLPENIVVTSGASHGLFAALSAVCRPGDRVLVPDPGFPLYRLAASILGLNAVGYPLDEASGYEPDWKVLDQLLPGARVLIWNFPSNPLGLMAPGAWQARILEMLGQHAGVVMFSDEVYESLCFSGVHLSPAALEGIPADRIVSIFSFSKSHAMTGWRVGYLHAGRELAATIARHHWGVSMSTPTVAQVAALAALRAPRAYQEGIRGLLLRNRDEAIGRLTAAGYAPHTPAAGFFLWVDIARSGLDAGTFTKRCAHEAGTLVSPGTDFSPAARHRIRLSYALSSDRLREGLDRLIAWLDDPGTRHAATRHF